MSTNGSTLSESVTEMWPALPYGEWEGTNQTLHMYTQILGKVKLALCPFLNQWWEVALQVTARGISTGTIPWQQKSFDVELDFIDHIVRIRVSDGRSAQIPLVPRSVADFYRLFMDALGSLGITVAITTLPSEVASPIAFDEDTVHASYDGAYVERWWRILARCRTRNQPLSNTISRQK